MIPPQSAREVVFSIVHQARGGGLPLSSTRPLERGDIEASQRCMQAQKTIRLPYLILFLRGVSVVYV